MNFFNKKKNRICSICNDGFSKYKELLEHAESVHGKTIIKCPLCNGKVIQDQIISHTKNAHHKVSMRWRLFFCWSPLAYLAIRKFWISLGIGHALSFSFIFASVILEELKNNSSLSEEPVSSVLLGLLIILGYVGIPIIPMLFLMRKWAKNWNEKIDSIINSTSDNPTQI